MRIKKFAATALLAIGATGIAAGTAYAQPAAMMPTVSGVDSGVAYATQVSADGRGMVTTVEAGGFALSSDARSVVLTNPEGAVIANMPLAFQVAGQKVGLSPEISEAGRTLTLTPVNAPAVSPVKATDTNAKFIDDAADLARHQYNAGVGALIGLGIGILVGLFFFGVGAIPGAIIGAGLGALIGWAQP